MQSNPSYHAIFKDLSYSEIEDIKFFINNENNVDNTLFIIKQFYKGRVHTTIHNTDYPLFEYLVLDCNLNEVLIDYLGVKCKSIQEYKRYLFNTHIGSFISDVNNKIRYKDFKVPSNISVIEIFILLIKFIRELGEIKTWDAYNKLNKISEWFLVDKNLNIKEYISPEKKIKAVVYWINFFPDGRTHITSSGNTFNLYSYHTYNKELIKSDLRYLDWRCTNIREIHSNYLSGITLSYNIYDRNNISHEFICKSFERIELIKKILQHLMSLCESSDWNDMHKV